MPAGKRVLDRFGLMRVELIDAARGERCLQARIERIRKGCELCGDRRQSSDGRDVMIRCVGPIDIVTADALERRIERAIAAGSYRGEHGGASYQRGEQMAKGSVC